MTAFLLRRRSRIGARVAIASFCAIVAWHLSVAFELAMSAWSAGERNPVPFAHHTVVWRGSRIGGPSCRGRCWSHVVFLTRMWCNLICTSPMQQSSCSATGRGSMRVEVVADLQSTICELDFSSTCAAPEFSSSRTDGCDREVRWLTVLRR